MTASAVRPTVVIPAPRAAGDDGTDAGPPPEGSPCPAVAHQRVVHRLVRRELRLLAGLPTTRSAWRIYGGRRHRAAVVRLRGAPPAR